MTLQLVLRQSFGLRHLDVSPRSGRIYTGGDLASDLRRFPFVRSIAGHGLMPFVDYGPPGSRIAWFSFVREPVARFLSHHRHHVEKLGRAIPLETFLRDPLQANRQVRFLAGEPNLARAQEVVQKRLAFVGRVDRFQESLLLLRERVGLPGLRVGYGRPRNEARPGPHVDRIREEAARLRDVILEENALDLAFYDWVVGTVWRRQVAEYGAQRLARDVDRAFATPERSFQDRIRRLESAALRKAVYVPMLRAGAAVRRRSAGLVRAPILEHGVPR